MTLPAEIDTCLGVAVDEIPSLVGRDRDKGFLWRPRDVYILHKNENTEHSPCGKRGHPLPAVCFPHCGGHPGSCSHPEDPRRQACRLQPPLRAKAQGSVDTWLMDTRKNKSRSQGEPRSSLAPCKQVRLSPPPASGLGQERGTPGWGLHPHRWGQARRPAPAGAPLLALSVSGQVPEVAPAAWSLYSELGHTFPLNF